MRTLLLISALTLAAAFASSAQAQVVANPAGLGQNIVGPADAQGKIPAGVLPWYLATRNRSKGVQNPAAMMQAQQQAASQAMMRQQAAALAAKAQEKARKKEQQNAVNSRKRAEEVAERSKP